MMERSLERDLLIAAGRRYVEEEGMYGDVLFDFFRFAEALFGRLQAEKLTERLSDAVWGRME